MKHFIRNIAFAAVAAAGLAGGASAAPVNVINNIYVGTLDGAYNLGTLDLANGSFGFTGVTGANSGSLTVDLWSSAIAQSAAGALQILIQAGGNATISVDTLTFGGNPLTLVPIIGGWATNVSGALPAQLVFTYSTANAADSIQISVAAVPLPAGGLLLIGGLGALAAFRRRKTAA